MPSTERQDKNTQIALVKEDLIQTNNAQLPFNLKNEIEKLKISVPLTELVKNESYRSQITENLNIGEGEDTINLNDDQLDLLFGPKVNGTHQQGGILPFYISLNIHDKILHNAMLDSRASHNLMPKAIMERLNLDITRPYKDLFSFDSSHVKFLGLIKYLCVTLVQCPTKSIVMDIVVADIPPKYVMLLSRSWGAKLQGSLQLDMSYATIFVFGQQRKLYRETVMKYMVSSAEKPQNFPIYSMHSYMDSFILYNSDHDEKEITAEELKYKKTDNENIFHESLWHLDFDGFVNRLGARAGVWIHNMENNHVEGHAFRLNFKCTNNMAKYESLILGLQMVIKLGAKRVYILGDSELIIKQINGEYFVNNPRLSQYIEIVLDLIKDLPETIFAVIF